MMHAPLRQSEPATFRFHREAGGVGLLTASYRRHTFVPHAHDTWTLAIVTRGAMNVHIGGTPDRLDQDSIVVIPPGVIHAASPGAASGWDYVSAYPTASAIAQRLEHLPAQLARKTPMGVVRSRWLVKLYRQFLDRLTHNEVDTDIALTRLVEGVWNSASAQAFTDEEPDGAIQKARSFIVANVTRHVTLDEMASHAGISPFYFVRRFKRAVGATPYAFYTQLRIQYAAELLRGGSSIQDAALRCGFSDQSHLNRQFKKVVGVTPGAYLVGVSSMRWTRNLHRLHDFIPN